MAKYKESGIANMMNYAVSGYVYFVAFLLVLFMITTLVTGVLSLVGALLGLASTPSEFPNALNKILLEQDLLHTIAFTIVLVKAYKILIAFAEMRHINLKFLVEIAIIAPTIELLFNNSSYNFMEELLFAAFAVVNLTIYLLFYKTLKKASDDYMKECQKSSK